MGRVRRPTKPTEARPRSSGGAIACAGGRDGPFAARTPRAPPLAACDPGRNPIRLRGSGSTPGTPGPAPTKPTEAPSGRSRGASVGFVGGHEARRGLTAPPGPPGPEPLFGESSAELARAPPVGPSCGFCESYLTVTGPGGKPGLRPAADPGAVLNLPTDLPGSKPWERPGWAPTDTNGIPSGSARVAFCRFCRWSTGPFAADRSSAPRTR